MSISCHTNCLHSALTPSVIPDPSLKVPGLSVVPAEYHDLGKVFSKQFALSLIALLTVASTSSQELPYLRVGSTTFPGQSKKLWRNTSVTGLIFPSSSPVGAGFFFVQKKDGSLQPCTDYRALNYITSKNKDPLPLLDAAFGPLHKAWIFSKLDLKTCTILSGSVKVMSGAQHLIHPWATLCPLGIAIPQPCSSL